MNQVPPVTVQLATDPQRVADQIYYWKKSRWFASVRLGDDVPPEWKRFWADAEALQKQAKAQK